MASAAQMSPEGASTSRDAGLKGLLAIFYAPGEVLGSLNNRSWVIPTIALALIALMGAALVVQIVGLETIMRNFYDSNPSFAERMGQERVEQEIAKAASPARRMMTYVMAPAGALFVALIMAGALMLGNMMTGSEVRFGRMLAIVAYASYATGLVRNIGTAAVLSSVKDFSGFDLQNAFPVNLALFVDQSSKFLHSLAGAFDLLTFWAIYLIALGLKCAVPRSTLGKHLGMVVGLWVLWVLGRAGFGALTGF